MKFSLWCEWLDFTGEILMPMEDMLMDPPPDEDVDALGGLLVTDLYLGDEVFDQVLTAFLLDSGDEEEHDKWDAPSAIL